LARRYRSWPCPHCVRRGPSSPPQKGAEPPPQFSAHVYCGQTAGWIKMTLGMEVGLGPGHIVLGGEPAPIPNNGVEPPIFGPFLLSPNGWINQDGTWHGGGPWTKPHCARWGPSSPPPKRGHTSQFSAHFYCRQSAGCIKMPLGMDVGDIVLDGDPASPPLKGHSRQFLSNVRCGRTTG